MDNDDDSLREPEKVLTKDSAGGRSLTPDADDLEKTKTQRDVEAGHGPATRVVTAQDWTGPDDPENPFNWPLSKRVYHVVISGLFGFSV